MKMYHKSEKKSSWSMISPASFAFFALGTVLCLIFLAEEPFSTFFLFLAFCVGALVFFSPLWGIMTMLLIRPLADFSSQKVLLQAGDFPLNFASALSLAVIGAFVLAFAAKNTWMPSLRKFPLKKQWLLFVAAAVLSLFFSINFSASVSEILRIFTIFAVFLLALAASGQGKKNFTKIIGIIVFSSVIPLAVSFWQFYSKTGLTLSFEDVPNRVFGTFAHPNPFAYFLSLALAFTLFFVFKKQNTHRIFAVGFVSLLVFGIGLTFTRGAWLLAAGTIFLIGAIRFRKFLAISVLAIFLAYVLIAPFQSRVRSLLAQGPSSSITWRISIWSDSLGYALERPIFGHGIGTAEELILEKRGTKFGSTIPHNDFLRMTLDIGFFGLAAYSYLLISAVVILAKKYKKTPAGDKKTALLALSCFSFALLFASAIDNIFEASALQMAFWASIGALLVKEEE